MIGAKEIKTFHKGTNINYLIDIYGLSLSHTAKITPTFFLEN